MSPSGRLGPQAVSLFHAEPVLFVDDDHAETMELDRILQQRVRPDDDARIAAGDLVAHLPASAAATWIRSTARSASHRSAPPS